MQKKRISHYKIIEKIGAGGMGVVYRAQDLILKRDVALKFLPADRLLDIAAKSRFFQEARLASKLDHPNICTIHEINESELGEVYIAMTYYAGLTLRGKLTATGSLPLKEALKIAIQVTAGMQQAHAAGIIHRDIKPENIIVTPEGLVKIMDFGLAKLRESDACAEAEKTDTPEFSSETILPTSTITAMYGTEPYMSPEQIDRLPVDERTDIFSLGVVLYEMISGRLPFDGFDNLAVMQAILCDPPKSLPNRRKPHLHQIEKIIHKALAKSPAARFSGMAELQAALQQLLVAIEQKPEHVRSRATTVISVLAIVILGIGLVLFRWPRNSNNQHPLNLKMYAIGNTDEIENYAAFSPDGKRIVFSTANTGNQPRAKYLGIQNLETGQIHKLLTNAGATDWSPDGSRLVYDRLSGIYIYDFATGDSSKILSYGNNPQWSPDGLQIVFSSKSQALTTEENRIVTYSFTNRQTADVTPDNGLNYLLPDWSPDGRWILCIGGEGSRTELWLIELATRRAHALSEFNSWLLAAVWCPSGKFIYFLSVQNGPPDVWRVPVDLKTGHLTGDSRQLTTGLDVRSLAISPDGNRLIFVHDESRDQIWQFPLPLPNDLRQHGKVILENIKRTENLEISPDGTQIVLETTKAGVRSLFLKSLVDQKEKILYQASRPFSPTWSADGQWIAFDAGGGDQADIWRIPAVGGPAEKLIASEVADWSPTFSPDGKYLCFLSNRTGEFELWLHDLQTKKEFPVTNSRRTKSRGFWSHDSRRLAYFEQAGEGQGSRIILYQLDSQRSENLLEIPEIRICITDKLVWETDDSAFYFSLNFSHRFMSELRKFSLKTSRTETIKDFFPEKLFPSNNVFAIYKGSIYFPSVNSVSDIWILEGLRH